MRASASRLALVTKNFNPCCHPSALPLLLLWSRRHAVQMADPERSKYGRKDSGSAMALAHLADSSSLLLPSEDSDDGGASLRRSKSDTRLPRRGRRSRTSSDAESSSAGAAASGEEEDVVFPPGFVDAMLQASFW